MMHNNQRGVALIITFLIMTVMLAIVLSISVILFSEIKIVGNLGNSVSALYASESGIEKTLYIDRKQGPGGANRGVCSICSLCGSGQGESYCNSCTATSLNSDPAIDGCDPMTCSNCHVVFSTEMSSDKVYNMDIVVNQQCKRSFGTIDSFGFYKGVSRAVRIDSAFKVSSLQLPVTGATATAQGQAGLKIVITADVFDPNNVGIESVVAAITGSGSENYDQCDPTPSLPFTECTYREVTLTSGGGGSYSKPWNFGIQDENYNINIMATDNDGNCVEVSNVIITYEQ